MITKNTFGVMFFTRKHRGKDGKVPRGKEGKAPIYARITVDGKCTELSVKLNVDVKSWNKSNGKAKGISEEIKSVNTMLEQIRSHLVECYQEIKLKKQLVTAEGVKSKYLGIDEQEHTLLALFDYHNESMKNILEWGTMKNYYTTKAYFEMYIKQVLHTSDIYLSQLGYKFVVGYEKFMKEYKPLEPKKPCGQNTVMKHIERLRKVVNLAIKNEWLDKDPFTKFKPNFERHDREFLTTKELAAIEAKDFSIARLQHAKDMFVFSCYTGLAYIDAFNLTPQNMTIGIDGEYWITTCRKKTDQPIRIPLLPKALEIIEKYKTDPTVIAKKKLLPVFSNQKLNAYLKEIADLCSITKPLTFHIARHTFATTVTLTNGVPIETVSKLLGHSSIRTTQVYAKVIERKVSDDMHVLKLKLNDQQNDENLKNGKVFG